MNRKQSVLFCFVVSSLVVLSGFHASAQQESLGERSLVFSCFYECKDGPVIQDVGTWQEITTLMLVNQSNRSIATRIVFLDGNQRIVATTGILLGPEDLDEINVCRTLEASQIVGAGGPVVVPDAGLIEVVLDSQERVGGVYGWVKNLLGRFYKNVDEPFAGRVSGIAKAECRLVPPSVTTPEIIDEKINAQDPIPPIIAPVLIEDSGNDPPTN